MKKKKRKQRKSSVRLPLGKRVDGLMKLWKGSRYDRSSERRRQRLKRKKGV